MEMKNVKFKKSNTGFACAEERRHPRLRITRTYQISHNIKNLIFTKIKIKKALAFPEQSNAGDK